MQSGPLNTDFLFDSSFDDAELVDVVERASQRYDGDVGTEAVEKNSEESVQPISNNATWNSLLSNSFKSVQFGKMENYTFNFYLGNKWGGEKLFSFFNTTI